MDFKDLKTNARELKVLLRGYKHINEEHLDISSCGYETVDRKFTPYLYVEVFL